ncbi:hypothetical protein M426DRAFT_17055 [Hypoxylon sp. CI-4A]|nr:hypothetical protein M426DRAFT_17055 [Hypoxylon sp. CI-4A]
MKLSTLIFASSTVLASPTKLDNGGGGGGCTPYNPCPNEFFDEALCCNRQPGFTAMSGAETFTSLIQFQEDCARNANYPFASCYINLGAGEYDCMTPAAATV